VRLGPFVALLLVRGVCGCSAITDPAASPAPVNVCLGTCPGYPADAGVPVVCQASQTSYACQINTVPNFVLVVTIPSLAPIGAGTTYGISRDEVVLNDSCMVYAPTGYCYRLVTNLSPRPEDVGALRPAYGVYLVNQSQSEQADRYLDIPAGYDVSLPVSVTFWPQWTPPDTSTAPGVATDARLLGLPLPPVFANVGFGVLPGTDPFGNLVVAPGAQAPAVGAFAEPFEWVAGLTPSISAPAYKAVVQVSPPFDDGYPDLGYAVSVVAPYVGANVNLGVTLGQPASYVAFPTASFSVKRADGKPWEGTWTAYYRDQSTLQSLTSRARFSGKTTSVRLNEVSTQIVNLASAEIVLQPPVGMVTPEFIDTAPSGAVGEVYPALPPVAHVSGTVQAPSGDAVSATLLFFSDFVDDVATCMQTPDTPPPSALFYEVRVQTADQLATGGAVGEFSLDLPQGRYAVVVQPSGESGFAKSTVRYLSVSVPDHPVCSGDSPTLDGVVITASERVAVTGSVVTADGRALANATVEFTPAAALAPGRFASPAASTGAVAEDLWPRPFTTTTATDGSFTVALDPFGQYDMTVVPQDGTNFPWSVRTNIVTTALPLQLSTLVVPPPFFLDLTLEDANENPLTGAVVQAFGFTSDGVAVGIGDALTDSNGNFTMMLSTAFASE